MKLISTNPARGYDFLGKISVTSNQKISTLVEKARQSQKVWKYFSPKERAHKLKNLKNIILKKKEKIAKVITLETGKPIREARNEIDFTLKYLDFFINEGPKVLAGKVIPDDRKDISRIDFEPYGVAAVITTWNFPLEIPIWGIIPNLIAGNSVIFKPAEESILVGREIANLIKGLKLPPGVFNVVFGSGVIGSKLVDSPIDLVWFTGSTKVGQEVYRKSGIKFIKSVLELGGNSPALIFKDADIKKAVGEICRSRFSNCGQSCRAVKRLFVQKEIFDEVVTTIKKELELIKVGDPLNEDTDMGSLISKNQLHLLESQVADAVRKGAKISFGGKRPSGLSGAYYLPTVLTNIKKNMRVYREEVFGPVLPIMSFKNEEEVVELANDTIYGLSAIIFTTNKNLAARISKKIEAGTVSINTNNYLKPQSPFGGYKKSGIGREHGEYGFLELVQIKHTYFKK